MGYSKDTYECPQTFVHIKWNLKSSIGLGGCSINNNYNHKTITVSILLLLQLLHRMV